MIDKLKVDHFKRSGIKYWNNPNSEMIIIIDIINIAVIFWIDNICNGLSLRKKSIGKIKPINGLIVSPVKVMTSLILGINIAELKHIKTNKAVIL